MAGVRIEVTRRDALDPTALAEIAAFVGAANADPTQHIGYVDTSAAEATATLSELDAEAVFALGRDADGALVGVLAAEWDTELGRTWLYGPWGAAPDGLYAAVRAHLPPDAAEHELFCDAANTSVAAFAARHGFTLQGEHMILELSRAAVAGLPPAATPAGPIPADQRDAFTALHETCFPDTHTGAAAILAGERHYLPPLGVLTDGALVGYVALTAEPEFGRAQVEYLGVAPGHRGRGLATDLVRSAVHTAFRDPRVGVVSLTVSATNPAALRVYQKAGFVVERTMRCYRVVWPQPTG